MTPTIVVAGAIVLVLHRAFRRSRLRTWMCLDAEPDDRLGRLGVPLQSGSSSHGSRWFNMDGMRHTFGGCCQTEPDRLPSQRDVSLTCVKCGGPKHAQGIYGGMMYLCERCDVAESTDDPELAGESFRSDPSELDDRAGE